MRYGKCVPPIKRTNTGPPVVLVLLCLITLFPSYVMSQADDPASVEKHQQRTGHSIPGVTFQVFIDPTSRDNDGKSRTLNKAAVDTVVKAFQELVQHRAQHQRFDQALTKNVLQEVVIESKVFNRDGKEFPFLVARTKQKEKVKLLISASRLKQDGYLHQPQTLAPRLAKEFQWVMSKAATKSRPKGTVFTRNLEHAAIFTNKEIRQMSSAERRDALDALLETYIHTVDAYGSLTNQPYYEMGKSTLLNPTHGDSTTKLYDIRIREALQLIVTDPYFWENTPKAVRSLLNGKVWHVLMARIDERDWTTRTRVVPKDKAVKVGTQERVIQPAKVLINYHRVMDSQNDLYADTQGLPMGALSAEQLARVIAWEIQNQITEKSMRGHVAEDEITSPD